MTFSPNVMHLLAEQTVTGATATDVIFDSTTGPAISINTDRHYTLYFDIFNPTGSTAVYDLFVNGDTTLTHYWSQAWNWSNVTQTNVNKNYPSLADQVITSQYCSGYVDIFLGIQGFLQYNSVVGRNFTNAGGTGGSIIVGAKTDAVIADITNITIHSMKSDATALTAIGVGSTFRLMRISPI